MFNFLSEIAPIVAFFIGYFYSGNLQSATLYILITSIVCVILCYLTRGKVSKSSLISSGVLLISAGTALISGNSMYIKIKPTILYITFASAFFISAIRNKPFLKYMFNHFVQLEDKSWNVLSYRSAAFFLVIAILNEIIWRNCAESTWVMFKIFGVIPIILIFLLLQAPFILKNRLPNLTE